MRVGAVVLHYRRGAAVADTLGALREQLDGGVEVVVVDNASGEPWESELRGVVADGVRVVVSDTNGGWAAGMRLGVAALPAGLDAVLLLTHECVLAPNALQELTFALAEDPKLGAVGPLLEDAAHPRTVWSSGGYVDRRSWTPLNDRGRPAGRTRRDWLDGAAILLRTAVLDAADVLDDRYFLYLEDVHLGLAVAAAGWGVAVEPSALAWQSSGGMPVYFAARNRLLLIRRWGGTTAVLRRLAFDALSVGRDAVTPARRHLLPVRFRGLRDGLSGVAGPPPSGVDGSVKEVVRS